MIFITFGLLKSRTTGTKVDLIHVMLRYHVRFSAHEQENKITNYLKAMRQ